VDGLREPFASFSYVKNRAQKRPITGGKVEASGKLTFSRKNPKLITLLKIRRLPKSLLQK